MFTLMLFSSPFRCPERGQGFADMLQ
jgi:hypothetical protein